MKTLITSSILLFALNSFALSVQDYEGMYDLQSGPAYGVIPKCMPVIEVKLDGNFAEYYIDPSYPPTHKGEVNGRPYPMSNSHGEAMTSVSGHVKVTFSHDGVLRFDFQGTGRLLVIPRLTYVRDTATLRLSQDKRTLQLHQLTQETFVRFGNLGVKQTNCVYTRR